MKKILVVEDEKTIRENVREYLKNANYIVLEADNGEDAIDLFYKESPDLIILDLMIPKIMGDVVCQKIRKTSNVPIIMLTAKSGEDEVIEGLVIGADDYITKPFSVKELVARVGSIIRRVDNEFINESVFYNNGDLVINRNLFEVYKNNKLCNLTKTEYSILSTLSEFSNKVFTREELVEIIFDDFDAYDRVIDTHIKNLRSKIEDDSSKPVYIVTVRGVGYKFGGSL